MTPIVIVPRTEAERSLWRLTLELAQVFEGLEWTLAGAQMVALLEREAGIESGRTTGDVDAVVGGPRAVAATRAAAGRLTGTGFERSAEQPHRYHRGSDQVDLLTVDHLRSEAIDLTTVPGGRRALATSRPLLVEVADVGDGVLPVPSVAGAIAMKLQAWAARRAQRDLEDLVRLLAVVEDVEIVRSELKPAERRALGRLAALYDPTASVWRTTRSADDARAAFARIRDG
ncbi:MAG: nucleotidyl transferase AbiEii/AbiGii toxin family protein [Chloroflexota bacterium]